MWPARSPSRGKSFCPERKWYEAVGRAGGAQRAAIRFSCFSCWKESWFTGPPPEQVPTWFIYPERDPRECALKVCSCQLILMTVFQPQNDCSQYSEKWTEHQKKKKQMFLKNAPKNPQRLFCPLKKYSLLDPAKWDLNENERRETKVKKWTSFFWTGRTGKSLGIWHVFKLFFWQFISATGTKSTVQRMKMQKHKQEMCGAHSRI